MAIARERPPGRRREIHILSGARWRRENVATSNTVRLQQVDGHFRLNRTACRLSPIPVPSALTPRRAARVSPALVAPLASTAPSRAFLFRAPRRASGGPWRMRPAMPSGPCRSSRHAPLTVRTARLQCAMDVRPANSGGWTVDARDFPTNRGGLCQKGWTAAELLTSPDRLLTPLVRDTRRGPLRPATWYEALDSHRWRRSATCRAVTAWMRSACSAAAA